MPKDKPIGCGYCAKEKQCPIRDRTNRAKAGCEDYVYWRDDKNYVKHRLWESST